MKRNKDTGFTLIELMIAVGIIFAILAVALPSVTEARIRTNEVNAIRMVGSIHTAQAQYQSQTGKFAVALAELNRHLPKKLAAGAHSGYRFVVEGTPDGYRVVAMPEQVGGTGNRTFTSDQELTVVDGNGKDIAH